MNTYKPEIRPSDEASASVGAARRVPRYSQMIGRRCEADIPARPGERPTIITKMLNYRQPPKQRDQRKVGL